MKVFKNQKKYYANIIRILNWSSYLVRLPLILQNEKWEPRQNF